MQGLFQGLFAAILALLFYTRAVAILGAARGAVSAADSLGMDFALGLTGAWPARRGASVFGARRVLPIRAAPKV